MKKEDLLIKVSEEGQEPVVHIRNIGPTDHKTMCGLDVNTAGTENQEVPLERGDKVNCNCCICFYENRAGLNNVRKSWILNN